MSEHLDAAADKITEATDAIGKGSLHPKDLDEARLAMLEAVTHLAGAVQLLEAKVERLLDRVFER